MGLNLQINKYNGRMLSIPYSSFGNLRIAIAKAFNDTIGEMYYKHYRQTDYDANISLWNSICNDDLDIFLFHSDCDGKLSFTECKKIWKAIKTIPEERIQRELSDEWMKDAFDVLMLNLEYCYKFRRTLYFV